MLLIVVFFEHAAGVPPKTLHPNHPAAIVSPTPAFAMPSCNGPVISAHPVDALATPPIATGIEPVVATCVLPNAIPFHWNQVLQLLIQLVDGHIRNPAYAMAYSPNP